MSIIDHESAAEETRRPGYRRRRLAGYDDGFELTFDYHIVDPGAGAPDHHHDVDELIVVLEGEVDATTNGVTERIKSVADPRHSDWRTPRVHSGWDETGETTGLLPRHRRLHR